MSLSSAVRHVAAGLCAASVLALAGMVHAQDYKLTILHTNDVRTALLPVTKEGARCSQEDLTAQRCFGGYARLAARIQAERRAARNVLLLDAGGQFAGTPFYNHYKQRAVSEPMNLVGFDAMTVGDREFVDGSPMLGQFVRAARFPLLGANVNVDRDPYLKDLIYPILVMDRGGERIGLIGYSTEHTARLSNPSATVRFEPIESAIRPWLSAMIGGMKVNKIIALSHAGIERDREVAKAVDGIDVIVGGHSRTLLANRKDAHGPYPTVLKGPSGQPVLMVQSGGDGRFLGRLEVTFDKAGRPKSWKGDSIELDQSQPEDPDIAQLMQSLAAPMDAQNGNGADAATNGKGNGNGTGAK